MGGYMSGLLEAVEKNECQTLTVVPEHKPDAGDLIKFCHLLGRNTSMLELSLRIEPKLSIRPDVKSAIAAMVGANRSIRLFQFKGVPATADLVFSQALAQGLQKHTMLENFYLDGCRFGDEGFAFIFNALENCTKLKALDVEHTDMSGAHAVAALCALLMISKKLISLNVTDCNLSGAPLQQLLSGVSSSTLFGINLLRNRLVDGDAVTLEKWLRSPGDRRLTMMLTVELAGMSEQAVCRVLNAVAEDKQLLRYLSLVVGTTSAKVVDSLVRLLRFNQALEELTLRTHGPKMSAEWAEVIVDALQSNEMMIMLDVQEFAVLRPDQQQTIEKKLQRNKSVPLRERRAAVAAKSKPAAPTATPDFNAQASTSPTGTAAVKTLPSSSPTPSSTPADAAAVPVMSPESLGAHVRSLGDMQDQLSQLQSSVQSHSSSLAPLSAEHQRRQAALSALRVIQSSESARGYHSHVRLLLTCAHVGAASLRSGNVEGSGSGAATAGVLAVEQLPKLIAKGLGKTVESIPLLGTGASVLTALIKAADARALNIKMQRVVLMARTPAELTALVDTLARRLTLLQWATVSSAVALAPVVQHSGFRGWAKAKLGEAKVQAMHAVKGERFLTDAEKAALADVERFLKAVAEDEPGLSFDCPPHVVGDEARADWLTLRVVRALLPGRDNYDEQLPTAAAAKPSPPSQLAMSSPSGVARPVAPVSALQVQAAPAAASPSPLSASEVSALLAKVALLEASHAERAAKEAEREAELKQVKADAEKHCKALAAHDAHIKKLQEQSPDAVDAGAGLAYATATARLGLSPQAQREADQRAMHQLQQQVDLLTAQMAELRQRAEDERARGGDGWDAHNAAAQERRGQQELGALRAQLMQRRASLKQLEEPSV